MICCAPVPHTMEEIRSLWNMTSLLLTTDDAVMPRTAARRWNVGNKNEAQGEHLPLDVEHGTVRENGTMVRMGDACTHCCGSEIRSWTVSAGAGSCRGDTASWTRRGGHDLLQRRSEGLIGIRPPKHNCTSLTTPGPTLGITTTAPQHQA